ncbi:MAG: DNA-binding domain-containing protein [Pseudomonadota bacterium]
MKNSLAELQQIFLHDIYHGTKNTSSVLNSETSKERLEIYFNNTQLTLIDLLRSLYPVIDKIVGTDFFNTLAKKYVQKYPLINGNRYEFGHQLAPFLTNYLPDQLPYLSDLAQLEWAYHCAYNADDAHIMTFEKLQRLANNDNDFNLSVHPSVQIILVNYNVLDIWEAHQSNTIEIVHLQQQLYKILIFRDVQNTIHMKILSSASQIFLATCSQSFLTALQTIDMENFQLEFAEYMVKGVFTDRSE